MKLLKDNKIKNIWQKIKKNKKDLPIFVIAPMADVTDYAFRKMFAKYGKPDVFWTEFVSCDGLCLAPKKGRDKILQDLRFDKKQKPVIAQIFGSNLKNVEKTAKMIVKLGFDGIDINMGCPDRSIEKQGAGASMIKNPKLAIDVIEAVRKGITVFGAPKVALSVKTRLGYNSDQTEEWLRVLLSARPNINLLTIHARTRKEMSKVPAKWDRIKRAVEIRDEVQSDLPQNERTLIFGNGDISSIKQALEKAQETNCDGVMIGRGIFGKPWFFNVDKDFNEKTPSLKKRLEILVEHSKLFDKHMKHKNFAVMRKHFKAYVEGFSGAKELRMQLMETQNSKQVEKIIKDFIKLTKIK